MAEAKNKKVLLVYYSWSGNAKKVAEMLGEKLGCETDRIKYGVGSEKPIICRLLYEALFRKTCEIKGDRFDPGLFERVVVITPVWVGGLSTPIRSYLKKHGAKIASFSLVNVLSGSGDTDKDVKDSAGKEPVKTALVLSSQVKNNTVDIESLLSLAD